MTAASVVAVILGLAIGFLIGRAWEERKVTALRQALQALDFKATEIREKGWRAGFEEGRAAEREFRFWDKAEHGERR